MENKDLEYANEIIDRILGYRNTIEQWKIATDIDVISLKREGLNMSVVNGNEIDFYKLKEEVLKNLNRRIYEAQKKLNKIFYEDMKLNEQKIDKQK